MDARLGSQGLGKGINELTEQIIAAAIEVHRELGPGLLESTYEICLAHELAQRGVQFERQKELPVVYKGVRVDRGYRLDLLVERSVVVEIKAVDHLERVHQAQVMSYLKLSGCSIGLLINFGEKLLKDGIRRLVRGLPAQDLLTRHDPPCGSPAALS